MIEVVQPRGKVNTSFSTLLLAYMLAIVAVCTLTPFQFSWPQVWKLSVELKAGDFGLNLFLFFIPGFLFQASRPLPKQAAFAGFRFGLLCSLFVECAQFFLVVRHSSPIDVLANASGAAAGAWLHDGLHKHVRDKVVNGLFLQLPLMGSFYLLVPLMWLNGLTAQVPAELITGPILGLMGAIIVASVWKHRLQDVRSRAWVGLASGLWYLIGSLPALPKWPLFVLASSLMVAICGWALASPHLFRTSNRRFELFTLKRALPVFVLYLLAPLLLASWVEPVRWHTHLEQTQILAKVEHLSAFTVWGYLVAESLSRRDIRWWTPALVSIGSACLLTFALFEAEGGASLLPVSLLLAVLGALCGVGIFKRQLQVLREWLAISKVEDSGLRSKD